jgi:hypothetical protein
MAKTQRTGKKSKCPAPTAASRPESLAALSEGDRAAAETYLSRRKGRTRLPKTKIEVSGSVHSVGWDHAVPAVADIHVANLLQSDDLAFTRGYTLQLAKSVCRSEILRAEDLDYALSVVRAIAPRDPTEALLAAQMAAVHAATMHAAQFLGACHTLPQQDSGSNMFNKLARTFAAQGESLKRYRSSGEQSVKVTHQHVSVTAGQAVVGINPGGGGAHENASQSHAPCRVDERGPALLSHQQALGLQLPGTSREGAECVPHARGPSRSAKGQG